MSFKLELWCTHAVPEITAGKNDVNAHVRYFKVGVDLRTDHPSVDKIKNGVQRCLQDPENAKNLQNILNKYHPFELIILMLLMFTTSTISNGRYTNWNWKH
ncbi:MAG: hypothetical protein R2806_19145 [Saprospiraceae bacterium]